MSDLPPVRRRGEVAGRWLAAAAAACCLLAALLPWVQAPAGFEGLRVTGVERPYGVAVLAVGLALAVASVLGWRRPERSFGVPWHAAAGGALAALAVAGWAWVDGVLHRDVPGVGVHPGTHGTGLRLVGVAAAFALAAAGYVARARR